MSFIDDAIYAFSTLSKEYISVRVQFDGGRIPAQLFKNSDTTQGFSNEVQEWMNLNGFEVYRDFFCKVGIDRALFFFRNEEIASHFKLKFL